MHVLRRHGTRTELDVLLGLSDRPEGEAWSEGSFPPGSLPPGFALAVSVALDLELPEVLARISKTGCIPRGCRTASRRGTLTR